MGAIHIHTSIDAMSIYSLLNIFTYSLLILSTYSIKPPICYTFGVEVITQTWECFKNGTVVCMEEKETCNCNGKPNRKVDSNVLKITDSGGCLTSSFKRKCEQGHVEGHTREIITETCTEEEMQKINEIDILESFKDVNSNGAKPKQPKYGRDYVTDETVENKIKKMEDVASNFLNKLKKWN